MVSVTGSFPLKTKNYLKNSRFMLLVKTKEANCTLGHLSMTGIDDLIPDSKSV